MDTEVQPEYSSNIPDSSRVYSSFVPLVVLVVALIGWSGYQAFVAYREGAELRKEFADAQPMIHAAEAAQTRLYSLAEDLVRTGEKNTFAAQIVKENNIRLKPKGDSSTSEQH